MLINKIILQVCCVEMLESTIFVDCIGRDFDEILPIVVTNLENTQNM